MRWKQEGLVFQLDGFCGACVRAGAATDARVFVDDGLVVNDFDGFNGATFCTGAATEAFLFIHNSCHFSFLLLEILSPGADARRLHTQPGAITKYIFIVCKFKQKRKDLFFGGQITGVEGYSESIATGLLAGINMARFVKGQELLTLPNTTMLGALTQYITFSEHKKLNPINSNWGILAPIEVEKKYRKDKKYKAEIYVKRSLEYLREIAEGGII